MYVHAPLTCREDRLAFQRWLPTLNPHEHVLLLHPPGTPDEFVDALEMGEDLAAWLITGVPGEPEERPVGILRTPGGTVASVLEPDPTVEGAVYELVVAIFPTVENLDACLAEEDEPITADYAVFPEPYPPDLQQQILDLCPGTILVQPPKAKHHPEDLVIPDHGWVRLGPRL